VPHRCLKNDQNHLLFLSDYAIIIMSACVLNGGALADVLCAHLTKKLGAHYYINWKEGFFVSDSGAVRTMSDASASSSI
jgi:hypothetical protein